MATEKQKRAAAAAVENGGNISQAMISVGYSPATAKTPQKLTQSEGFRELMQQMGLDDATLVGVLKDGLSAENEGRPDFSVRHKYLETGLRLKGLGKAEGSTSISFISYAKDQREVYDI